MISRNETQQDWFDGAKTSLANSKVGNAKSHSLFSSSAEQVLNLALQAALSLKHDAVGAEHLLAGIVKFNSDPTAAALRQAGLTLPALREEIESARGVGEQKQVSRRIPYTPRSKGIINRAQARVRSLKGVPVEVEDLLMEILAETDGLPARIFHKRGIDIEAIKSAVLRKACE